MVQRKINHSKVISSTQGSLSDIEPKKWERIALIDALVRPTLEQEFGKIQAQEIAARLQIHWTTVYRYRRRLLDLDLRKYCIALDHFHAETHACSEFNTFTSFFIKTTLLDDYPKKCSWL